MTAKGKSPQVRLDDATAERLAGYIREVAYKSAGKVQPKAKEIASAAVNAWLDLLDKKAKKRGA